MLSYQVYCRLGSLSTLSQQLAERVGCGGLRRRLLTVTCATSHFFRADEYRDGKLLGMIGA